jgi:hypothetical protein
MPKVEVKEIFTIEIQAKDEMNFTDSNGKEVHREAQPARKARIINALVDDAYILPLELPETFTPSLKVGDIVDLQCRGLSVVNSPIKIQNVNRVISK